MHIRNLVGQSGFSFYQNKQAADDKKWPNRVEVFKLCAF